MALRHKKHRAPKFSFKSHFNNCNYKQGDFTRTVKVFEFQKHLKNALVPRVDLEFLLKIKNLFKKNLKEYDGYFKTRRFLFSKFLLKKKEVAKTQNLVSLKDRFEPIFLEE